MFYSSFDPYDGAVFSFSDAREVSFWMKDTFFPMDIVMLNEDGAVVRIFDYALPLTVTSRFSVDKISYVLELPAGWSTVFDIGIGDSFISQFEN